MNLTKNLGAIVLAAATLWLGTSGAANAGIGSDHLTVVSPSNIGEVLSPPAGAKYSNVFVEVCPASEQVCQDEVSKLGLGAAVANGGWMGPKLSHGQLKFYVMDPTPANLQALKDACKAAPANAAGAAVCQVDGKQYPLFIMFRTDGSKSETVVGPDPESNFHNRMWQFTR